MGLVGEDFEMNRAEQIRQSDDHQVIGIISGGKMIRLDWKAEMIKPEITLTLFDSNIEYKDGKYINNKKKISTKIEYSVSKPYQPFVQSGGGMPKLSCSKVKLTLAEEGLNFGKKGLFQTSIMEKEWTEGLELELGKSYSNTVEVFVEDKYVPQEVKAEFPLKAIVTTENGEYAAECKIPVANLDIQAQKTAAKKPNNTGNQIKESFEELSAKDIMTLDSTLDYYLDQNQKQQVTQFLKAWIGNVMMSVEEEAEASSNSYESKVVNQLLGKVGVNTSTMLFVKSTNASVEVSADTAKYGKRTFMFSLEMSSFSIGQGKPFGNKGDISYRLKNENGIPGNVPKSGVGGVVIVDFDNFVGHLKTAAEKAIGDAYSEACRRLIM